MALSRASTVWDLVRDRLLGGVVVQELVHCQLVSSLVLVLLLPDNMLPCMVLAQWCGLGYLLRTASVPPCISAERH